MSKPECKMCNKLKAHIERLKTRIENSKHNAVFQRSRLEKSLSKANRHTLIEQEKVERRDKKIDRLKNERRHLKLEISKRDSQLKRMEFDAQAIMEFSVSVNDELKDTRERLKQREVADGTS